MAGRSLCLARLDVRNVRRLGLRSGLVHRYHALGRCLPERRPHCVLAKAIACLATRLASA
eukprot:2607612-Pyramimonas_sp.AAC.1